MCSFNLAQKATQRFADLYCDRSVAQALVDSIVNGEFLKKPDQATVADKVAVCVSTICALVKEFNLDWISEQVSGRTRLDQHLFMATFGQYLELPLRTLSDLLKRVRYAGRKSSPKPHGFQFSLDVFWDALGLKCCDHPVPQTGSNLAFDPRVVLLVYLATALACHRMFQKRQDVYKPIPWTIGSDKAGKNVVLRYHYWSRTGDVMRRTHFDYRLRIALPKVTAQVLRKLNEDLKLKSKLVNHNIK